VSCTLLIGTPQTTWRDWLRAERGRRDLLCLDPADPEHEHLARVVLLRGERPLFTRFYGSLDPQRAPHVLIAAVARALPLLAEDALIQLFAYRPTPTLRQAAQLVAELVRPERVLASAGVSVPFEAETVELDKAFTPSVQLAQRKAQWMKLRENGEPHEVDLRAVRLEGARLLAGTVLDASLRDAAGLGDALHAERQGRTLFVVAPYEAEDGEIGRAMDVVGCSRAVFAHPDSYRGLLCGFARNHGEDFGTGFVEEIDWTTLRAQILCDAVPPAPVQTLRLGALRVDASGNERGEVRPWLV
jgi:polynucleotide 5'-kinase involved in rRNA processing